MANEAAQTKPSPLAPMLPPAIFLMGATATGKTGLAIELAAHFPVDIISVDSAMVYRGMDIGSAKPDAEILRQAPHALVDIREPTQAYSAADFVADATEQMHISWAAGRVPLLAGGTMLYFNALENGLSPLPTADPELRQKIDAKAEQLGWPALHQQLQALDPVAAARIKANDRQRIQRALEVCELSGVSMTSLQQQQSPLQARVLKLVLTAGDRSILHQRIEQRFDQMLAAGFLAEVKALMQVEGLDRDSTAMRSVGYRQAWDYLITLNSGPDLSSKNEVFLDFRQKVISATRQLAKRQLTWLRQIPLCLWYDWPEASNSSRIIKEVELFLEK